MQMVRPALTLPRLYGKVKYIFRIILTKIKAGLLLTSLACAAGATAALVLLQKKREEEVYHEAELKAMDELEEMMREDSDCASCACAEECAAADVQDIADAEEEAADVEDEADEETAAPEDDEEADDEKSVEN